MAKGLFILLAAVRFCAAAVVESVAPSQAGVPVLPASAVSTLRPALSLSPAPNLSLAPALLAPAQGLQAPVLRQAVSAAAAAAPALNEQRRQAYQGFAAQLAAPGAQLPAEKAKDLSDRFFGGGSLAAPAEPGADLSAPGPQAAPADWRQGVFQPKTVAKPLPGDPLGVTVHRLSNGMTVYLSPNKLEPRIYSEIAVRAGSRHDPLEATGMAHYLEHMQFKGTTRLGTLDYAQEKPHLDRIQVLYDQLFETKDPQQRSEIFKRIDQESQAAAAFAVPNEFDKLYAAAGMGDINAHTGLDETVYEASFPSNRSETWARTEADRLQSPVYRLFQPELEAVYEEYNRGLDDPDQALFDPAKAAVFQGHPYGRDIIGTGEHLKNPSLSRMRSFFRQNYRPNNMAILLSGDFDRQQMLALLERTFGQLSPAPVPPAPAAQVTPLKGVQRIETRQQAEEKVLIGWQMPGATHPDMDALTMMNLIMFNGRTGIVDTLLNQAQKIKDAGGSPYVLREAGGYFLEASAKEGQTLEQAEALLMQAVAKLKTGAFSDENLKAVIAQVEVSQKQRLEKNRSRVSALRNSFVNGEEWEYASRLPQRLATVTRADILRVAKQYLGENRVVVYRRKGDPTPEKVAKPGFTAVPIDPTRQSAFFKELLELPAQPMAPRFLRQGRDYQASNQPWGRLYWTQNPINDVFRLELHFDGGVAQDGRLKLAFNLLQLSGAGKLGVEQFEKKLFEMGSDMEMKCEDRECVIKLEGLEKNLEPTLRLALLRLLKPNVAPETVEQMVEVERGDRADRKLDPEQIFSALTEFASRGRQSAIFSELSPEHLDSLTEAELKGALRGLLGQSRSALYTGTKTPEQVAEVLASAQGRLSVKPAPSVRPRKLLSPKRNRVVFVHHPGMKQALVGAYAADGVFDPAKGLDMRLYNEAMAGGMGGAYFQEVRESRALAYSVAGGYQTGSRTSDDSLLWSYAGTQADKAAQTAKLLTQLMRQAPLTEERFANAKRSAEESYRAESPILNEIPRRVLTWERMGYQSDPRPGSFRKLAAYGLERLKKFAARFSEQPLTITVVGDRDSVDLEGLKKLGDFEERSVDELFPF